MKTVYLTGALAAAAFAVEGAGKKPSGPLVSEGVIEAPVAEVWAAFTTQKGLEAWMVPHAEIDLRVGGKMLTHYDPAGTLGDPNTIENTILSFEPNRMLSIKATKAPASFPFKASLESMWSVLYFSEIEPSKTHIRCVGLGYGEDEESQKLRSHFEHGNAYTIRQLQAYFARGAKVESSETNGANRLKEAVRSDSEPRRSRRADTQPGVIPGAPKSGESVNDR